MLRVLLAVVLGLMTTGCLGQERGVQGLVLYSGGVTILLPSDGSGPLKVRVGDQRLEPGDCVEVAIPARNQRTTQYKILHLKDRALRIAHTPDPPIRARLVRRAAHREGLALCALPRLEEFSGVLSCSAAECLFGEPDWRTMAIFNPFSESQLKALAGLASDADLRSGRPYNVRVRGALFDGGIGNYLLFIVRVEDAQRCPTCEPVPMPPIH